MFRSKLTGHRLTEAVVCASLLAALPAAAQVFTVEPEHVEKHYTQFPPTHVRYSGVPLTTLSREQLIRFMEREQGFAMRPLPIAVLTLHANGTMDPAGDKYVNLLHTKGIAAGPGARVIVTDIRIDRKTIELDLNGGPFHKHRFLRHVTIGMGVAEAPLAQDDGRQPTGTRLTLEFEEPVPDLTGEQLEALLKPMIDFGVKSPAEAYAETLPDFLRDAIKQHRVLVGMNRDMVTYAKGMPIRKIREADANGRQFEDWIYGEVPQPVEFVRFEGRYVVRVEMARVGEPVVVHAENEMGDYWGNQPVVAANQHQVQMGDQSEQERSGESATRSAPTLRQPGDPVPTDDKKTQQPVMAPVNFPKDQQRPGDPGYTPTVSAHPPAAPGTASGQKTDAKVGQPGASSGTRTDAQQPGPASQPANGNPTQNAPAQSPQ